MDEELKEFSFDVVVIGAGISGLSGARLLTQQGLRVLVLEARDRVGGRTYTIRDPEAGGYVDLGGAYVGPTQRRIGRLARELGLKFYKIPDDDKYKTIFYDGGNTKKYEGVLPAVYNPLKILDFNNVMRKISYMSRNVSSKEPWNSPGARDLDQITVKEFLERVCWTGYTKFLVTVLVRALLCAEPHNISLLFLLWYISSGQGLKRLLNVRQGAQERKFIGGSAQLSEKMAEKLNVLLSTPVSRVVQTSDSTVTVHTSTGKTFTARHVISAIPLALLNRISFEPPLSSRKLQLIQRMPMGRVLKTVLYYDRPYWKEKGLSGEFLTFNGPILHGMDDSKPDGSYPALISYIRGEKATELALLTLNERKDLLAKQYSEMFKISELISPSHYMEMNWMAEEYSGGCYVGTFPPGALSDFGSDIREPFMKVHFAGTETASYWAGYMEGAAQAGERAAREILHLVGKIKESEIWMEEPPCEDFPEIPFKDSIMERVLPSPGAFLTVTAVSLAIGLGLLVRHRYL